MSGGKLDLNGMAILHGDPPAEPTQETVERLRHQLELQKDIILGMEQVVRFHEPEHPSLAKLARLRRRA